MTYGDLNQLPTSSDRKTADTIHDIVSHAVFCAQLTDSWKTRELTAADAKTVESLLAVGEAAGIEMKYIVKDSLNKVSDKAYFTPYHAEQMARALNMHEATNYQMYYGGNRFIVSKGN